VRNHHKPQAYLTVLIYNKLFEYDLTSKIGQILEDKKRVIRKKLNLKTKPPFHITHFPLSYRAEILHTTLFIMTKQFGEIRNGTIRKGKSKGPRGV